MSTNINILNQFINNLDPFDMLKYGEDNIYIKEVKLLLNNKIITTGKIKDIFYIGYKEKIPDDMAKDIYFFIAKSKIKKFDL